MNRLLLIALLFTAVPVQASETEGHGHHHVAVGTGAVWLKSKSSVYLGVDYIYSWNERWGAGAYYEEVSGDFDLQVWGLLFNRKFGDGWKFNFGPGIERKIKKDKTLLLFRTQLGYDWHKGHWSFGPVVTVDLIEDGNTTYYAGVAVGYGW